MQTIDPKSGPILEIGAGSGRNTRALLARGFEVVSLEDDPERVSALARTGLGSVVRHCSYTHLPQSGSGYAAVLSTNGLLHGTHPQIRAIVAAINGALAPGGHVFCTLGSTSDQRYGRGSRIDDGCYAATEGDERDVPHAFFDEAQARALFRNFTLLELRERSAAETAGRWAHSSGTQGTIHWFVHAQKELD